MSEQNNNVVVFHNPLLKEGFSQMPTSILRCKVLSPTSKTLYCLLLSYAWQDNFAFPSQATLAECLNMSDRQIRRYLTELEKERFIKIQRQGLSKPNIYHFLDFYTERKDIFADNTVINPNRTNTSSLGNKPKSPERSDTSIQKRKITSDQEGTSMSDNIETPKNTNITNTQQQAKPVSSCSKDLEILKEFKLKEYQIKNITGEYEESYIKEKIAIVKSMKDVKSKEASLLSALKNDWQNKDQNLKAKEENQRVKEREKAFKREDDSRQVDLKKAKVSQWIEDNQNQYKELCDIEYKKALNTLSFFANWDEEKKIKMASINARVVIQKDILNLE